MRAYGKFIDYKKTGKPDKSSTSYEAIKKYRMEHNLHIGRSSNNPINLLLLRWWTTIKQHSRKIIEYGSGKQNM